MKVSIIMPVYNAERRLDICISSILNQKFTDYELILVNDGSTDSSGSICDKYKRLDNRVVTIHTDNNGAASARNTGIKNAKGHYLQFIDADDEIMKESTEYLVAAIEKTNSDCVIAGFINDDGRKKTINLPPNMSFSFSTPSQLAKLLSTNSLINVLWNKLYVREKITSLIPEDIKVGEDLFFNLYNMRGFKKIYCLDQPVYIYMHDSNSITQTYRPDYILDLIRVDMFRTTFIQENELMYIVKKIFISDIHDLLCILCKNMKLSKKDKFNQFKSISTNDYVRSAFRQCRYRKINNRKHFFLKLCIDLRQYYIGFQIYFYIVKGRKGI